MATINAVSNKTDVSDFTIVSGSLKMPTAGKVYFGTGLYIHNTGTQNTFMGINCGGSASGGTSTGTGWGALYQLTTGDRNTAYGNSALYTMTSGNDNTALGYYALVNLNVSGANQNTAVGSASLGNIATGKYNIALGYSSGSAHTLANSSNIDIGNVGVVGENNVIRIGTYGTGAGQQNRAYIVGVISEPNQSAFEAYVSSTVANVTGDGTAYTVIFDTEDFDQNADYNNATGVFTAPVTGKYQFNTCVHIEDLDQSMTSGMIALVTTGRTYYGTVINPNAVNMSACTSFLISVLVPMTATDTASIVITISGSGKTADVTGHATIAYSHFSGHLAC